MFGIVIWIIMVVVIIAINKSSGKKTAGAKIQGQKPQKRSVETPKTQHADKADNANRAGSANSGAYVKSAPVRPNQTMDTNRKRSMEQPNIVERAKENSRKYTDEDTTLEQMEREHQHSERVGSAVAGYVETEREEHRRMHEEPAPRVEETSLLGTVEDLMVKGYDGNLSFERDFIGEASDMLARFTLS